MTIQIECAVDMLICHQRDTREYQMTSGDKTSLPFPFVAMRGCCALMFAISRRYQNPIPTQAASKNKEEFNIGGSPAGIKEWKVKVMMRCMISQNHKILRHVR